MKRYILSYFQIFSLIWHSVIKTAIHFKFMGNTIIIIIVLIKFPFSWDKVQRLPLFHSHASCYDYGWGVGHVITLLGTVLHYFCIAELILFSTIQLNDPSPLYHCNQWHKTSFCVKLMFSKQSCECYSPWHKCPLKTSVFPCMFTHVPFTNPVLNYYKRPLWMRCVL